jgi:drug/metabolite transporter (DMT)-like permease
MTPYAPLKGMLFSALAFLFFTGFDTASKYLAGGYSVFQIMSVEFVIAAALISVYALSKERASPGILRIGRPHLHVLRCGCQVAGQSLAFLAIPHLSLSEFYIIVFCMPAMAVLKAGWFLKERAAAYVWPVLGLNFAGVLIALRPDQGANWWALLAFSGIVLLAAGQVVLRVMARTETAEMTGITTTVALALGALVVTPFVYRPMELGDFALMALGGVLFAPAQMLLIAAFRIAPVAMVAPPQFLQIVYGAIAGYLVFGDVPTVAVLAGGGMVIAANGVLIYAGNKAPRGALQAERVSQPAS